jgi:hypothetical protein
MPRYTKVRAALTTFLPQGAHQARSKRSSISPDNSLGSAGCYSGPNALSFYQIDFSSERPFSTDIVPIHCYRSLRERLSARVESLHDLTGVIV